MVSRNATLTDTGTPAVRGFRMPAEWARHRGTWLSWPHKEASWPGNFGPVHGVIAEMIRQLAPGEEVHINVNGDGMEQQARFALSDAHVATNNVFFHHIPTDDAWCRDHGPIFVQRDRDGAREELILDWEYNVPGGTSIRRSIDDDVVPSRIGTQFGIPVEHPAMILEGGSIDVNGREHVTAHHRGLPPQPQSQSVAHAQADREAPPRLSRRNQYPLASAMASWAMTPMGTLMT